MAKPSSLGAAGSGTLRHLFHCISRPLGERFPRLGLEGRGPKGGTPRGRKPIGAPGAGGETPSPGYMAEAWRFVPQGGPPIFKGKNMWGGFIHFSISVNIWLTAFG